MAVRIQGIARLHTIAFLVAEAMLSAQEPAIAAALHGGFIALGDSGSDDVRAVSGHSTLEVTRIHAKANQEKALAIAARRREHIATLAGGVDEDNPDVE